MTAHSAGTSISTSTDNLGFTAGVRIEVPIVNSVTGNAQFRWVHFPDSSVYIPGKVDIHTDIFYIGFGVTMQFVTPSLPVSHEVWPIR